MQHGHGASMKINMENAHEHKYFCNNSSRDQNRMYSTTHFVQNFINLVFFKLF